MGGFFGDNPADTVVGSTDATESTIAEDAVSQTDTASGFYQGSPEQTTTDAYTADALASKNAASVSEANAATSAANAATSETNAATSATNAASSETSVSADASAASASAASALASKNAAETAETNAETAETNAETAETNAASSATSAANSASTATTKASEASTSASNAATSETNAASSATSASGSATTATTKASEASTSASNASTSESNAASSATSASTSASTATTKASDAATSETNAATSATNAATSATNSASSATASSNSASSATTAQSAAEAARDAALAAFDSFDDRYLGQRASNPSTDNDGNALVAGTLVFNTTTDEMKVYDGSAWLNAYASLSGALLATSNLSDLNNAGTARTNLGLGTAATTDASAYATAAQADQTVSLTGAGTTTVSGTYPNFTITGAGTTYTAGSGLSLTGTEFANTAPDQTVALTGAGATSISGTYPNFTITSTDTVYTLPFTDNSSNWDTAFGWGNHASAGYLTSFDITTQTDTKYLRSNTADTAANRITFTDGISLEPNDGIRFGGTADVHMRALTNNANSAIDLSSGSLSIGGIANTVWHAGNDGAGSGLDADNLDGVTWGSLDKDVGAVNFNVDAGNLHGLRFWNGSDSYRISMSASGISGAGRVSGETTSDYNMYFKMTGGTNRGFVFQSDTANRAGIDASGNIRTVANVDCNYLRADRIYSNNDGSTGYFYNDSSTRTAYAGGEFYLQTSVPNYYNYATNIYLGNTSGDTVRFRGNVVNHNGFSFDAEGDFSTTRDIVSTARNRGVFGVYSSYHTDQIWSMGTAYRNHSSGTNFGNLYGLAYKHTNNSTGGTMASGHQMVWCQNGSPKAAMGTNIWTSGNVTAYSDIRVKTNIEHIPNALDKVCKLNGYTFDRTDVTFDEHGLAETPVRQTGVIAQEVLKVLPEAVIGDEEGHYSVAYGNMVGLLIESIKELKAEVDDLKAQLEAK